MLENFIKNRIIHSLPFAPNEGQAELLQLLTQFILSKNERKAFVLRGYAGTGKTSIMAALVKALGEVKQSVILLAPTGRAAKVLARYANKAAYTIHKYIYRQDKLGGDSFSLSDNLHKHALFIVDEASMISGLRDNPMFGSGILLDDLVRYVYNDKGCYLLMLGDDAQLPPIGSNKSPALDETYMSGYQLSIFSHTLTEVARQAIDSGILENATRLRPLALGDSTEEIRNGLIDNIWKIIEFRKDICTVSGTELLEAIEQSYSEVGVEETILLTRTNKRTNIYNQGIRARILWKEEEIGNGDRVMVCKNNYFWTEKYDNLPFLANGDMLEIVRLRNIREIYGYHFADAQLRSLDYDWEIDVVLWLETIHSDNPDTIQKMHKDLFYKIAEDYPELQHRRKELTETIYKSPYYNALQIRMAYAITGHKSQGGQWARVFIDPYKGGEEKTSKENIIAYYRWLYTTITRATEKVYFIKNT